MSAALPLVGEMRWHIVLLLVGAGVVAAFQVGKAPMAMPEIQHELEIGLASASWLLAAFAVVGAVAGAPIGLAVDRLGARRVAVASLACMGAGAAIGASAAAPAALLATRVVEGLGFLGVTVAVPALLAAAAPADLRERALALWATFMPVGMTLVMLAAPLLSAAGWRGFWLANAVLLTGYAALLAWGARGITIGRVAPARSIFSDVSATVATPGPWILGGLFAVFSATFFAVFGFLPAYLAERLRVTPDVSAMMSALAVAASAAGNLLCGHLLGRGSRPLHLLLAAFAVMAICGVAVFQPSTADAAILPLAIGSSLAGGAIPVVVFNSTRRFAPRDDLLGATVGFAMQGNSMGLIVGPAAGGKAAEAFGWQAIGAVVIALAVGAGLLVVWFGHCDSRGRRHR